MHYYVGELFRIYVKTMIFWISSTFLLPNYFFFWNQYQGIMHYYAARIMEYFPHYWRLHARAIVSPTSAFTSIYYLFLFIYLHICSGTSFFLPFLTKINDLWLILFWQNFMKENISYHRFINHCWYQKMGSSIFYFGLCRFIYI